MFRPRQALPLEQRTEARLLLHDQLIASLARRPLDVTRTYVETWLDTVAGVASHQGPVVFEWFVVGPPTPELLEIADELRMVRRAELRGDFDEEARDWYEQHGDDAEPWEPPTTSERVAAALAGRPGFGALATRLDIHWIIGRRMGIRPDNVFDVIDIGLCVELLMSELADVARIGLLALADGCVPGERRHGFGLAA